jgi:nitrite reductase/ring-hydroxylating ferredoxin subunit
MTTEQVEIAETSEFDGDGSRVITEIHGQEIAIIRHDDDYYAVANYCVHQSGPLCEGALTGKAYVEQEENWNWKFDQEKKYMACPWHGWMFDIETGKSAKDENLAVPTYDIEVDGESIYLVE